MGNRVSQTVGATVTEYLLDTQPGLAKVIQSDDGTNVNRFVHDPRGIHSQKDSSGNWVQILQDAISVCREDMDTCRLTLVS